MKTLIILIIALFSQISFANEWKHINQKVDGFDVRISYTTAWSPATYGSSGGLHEGILYVDLYSSLGMIAKEVEISEVASNGRASHKIQFELKEDHERHFYAKKPWAESYADYIWFGKTYQYEISVNGRTLKGRFKL